MGAEQQDGYVRQLEAFAEANRERLVQLYARYRPGGTSADESHCHLTHQPESVVVCERLDVVPMWLDGVWNEEIDAELTLEWPSIAVRRCPVGSCSGEHDLLTAGPTAAGDPVRFSRLLHTQPAW
ncbi:hypothetical protein [Streptomyces mirabilis]|uniref:hypothetical protein n=1 Tax=Streptomyces mirabilis TaxID=68239 RepID=UPI0033AF78CA